MFGPASDLSVALGRRLSSQRPLRAVLPVLAFAATGLLVASPAIAAERPVQVTDNAFVPAAVAVLPGDSVRWTYSAGADHHNVHFEDEAFVFPNDPADPPWTGARLFSAPGVYRYYCEEHGAPGGVGMAGIVYVNQGASLPGAPPDASFTVSRTVATLGQTVTFDGAPSSDPDAGGGIVRYEWDLDGNGSYETDRGGQPTTSFDYTTPGQRTVSLRVTDKDMRTAVATQVVTVTNVPLASFSATPNPVQAGQGVSFDASSSSDPDGTIVKYEWDLDGNGSYELDTGTTSTTARTYPTQGTMTIGLRVTDNLGATSTTTQPLQVNAPPPPPPPPPAAPPPPPPAPPAAPPPPAAPAAALSCGTLKGTARATCMQRRCRTLKGTRRATCIRQSCRYVAKSRRASCVRSSCRYVAKSKRTSCLRSSCRYLTGAKARACARQFRARTRSRA